MRRVAILIVAFFGFCFQSHAQEAKNQGHTEPLIYTFFVNIAPDQSSFPLVGMVNIARGNHQSAQVGLINWNHKDMKGAQIGLINNSRKSFTGAQVGLINTVAGKTDGFQLGLINTTADSSNASQIGLINTKAKDSEGVQVALINVARTQKGAQIGLINYADSLSKGTPFGLISFVKRGGYHAAELGVNEMYPVNFAYKIGVRKFYTTFVGSYNPEFEHPYALGLGFGTIIPAGSFFINPEIVSQNTVEKSLQQFTSLTTYLGYSMGSRLEVVAGPALILNYTQRDEKREGYEPLFSIYERNFNDSTRLLAGLRFGIRYNFAKSNPI